MLKVEEYNKLQKEIKEKDFHSNYSSFSKISYYLSFIGNLFSILFAYFFVYGIINSTILEPTTSTTVLVFLITGLILVGTEIIKRFVFDKFSQSYIKFKFSVNETVVLGFVSLAFVVFSFYLSLNGAKEYANKDKEIKNNVEQNVDTYEDSIKNIYQVKIDKLDSINNSILSQNNKIDEDITNINNSILSIDGNDWSSNQKRNSLKELSKARTTDKERNNQRLKDNDISVKEMKKEQESDIKKYLDKQEVKAEEMILDNADNPTRFIIFSTVIEFLILFGIYFMNYYKIRSVRDYEGKASKDPKFKQYNGWNEILDVIYSNAKMGDYIPFKAELLKILKTNSNSMSPKEAENALTVMTRIGILSKRGSKKEISMTQGEARERIREYFKID